MSKFDELMETPQFKTALEQLPNDEREELVKTLREIMESFEKNVIGAIDMIKQNS